MQNTLTLCFVVLCALIGPISYAEESKVVRLASGDWYPYTSSEEGQGLVEKVVARAFAIEGYEVVIEYYPWVRSAKLVRYSKLDGTFPWYSNDERQRQYTISKEAILHADTLMFYHKDVVLEWDAISDLAKYEVGSVPGYASTKILEDNNVKTISATSMEENILKLYRHRIDVLPIEKQVGLVMIEELTDNGLAEIRIGEKALISNPMFMLFPNNDRGSELSTVFDRGISKLKANGCYDRLMSGQPCL